MTTQTARYSTVAIILHWLIAASILFMIWLGWNMHGNENMYQLHKSIGISILILTVARLMWRLLNPPPALDDEMNALEKTASHLVHIAFYGLMLILPLTGWILVSTSYEFDVPTVLFGLISWPDLPGLGFLTNETGHGAVVSVHEWLAKLTLALLFLHVAGALKHEFSAEQGVLKRMLPGLPFLKGELGAPAASRGYGLAFGSAAAVFAAIAAVPMINGLGAQTGSSTAQEIDAKANWQIDYTASSIDFGGLHDGNAFTGNFPDWTAAIWFDPANPEAANITVSVQTGSADTSKKLYTDSLKSAEWLNPTDYPAATVEILDIVKDGPTDYGATARLTLKDKTVDAPFLFTLVLDGDTARMTGTSTLLRQPLDLGQVSDPGADWVSEEVNVEVEVVASRLD